MQAKSRTVAKSAAGKLDQDNRAQLILSLNHNEQSWFWTRFAAFSAMNAALLVLLSVEKPGVLEDRGNELIAWGGLALSVAWVYIQAVSLWYVNRYKPALREVLEGAGLLFRHPKYFPLSSTQAGCLVAALVVALWTIMIAHMYPR